MEVWKGVGLRGVEHAHPQSEKNPSGHDMSWIMDQCLRVGRAGARVDATAEPAARGAHRD